MKSLKYKLIMIPVLLLTLLIISIVSAEEPDKVNNETGCIIISGLDECISIALENNRHRQVSKYAVEIAEAQHKQALSSFWPQVNMRVAAVRIDEDHNFIFPAQNMQIGQTSIPVSEQDIKLMDKDILTGSVGFVYPLYTGGMRRAITRQAAIGVKAAKESARRTDLQVIYDVKRMYYGSNLATSVRMLGEETLERFEVTLELTDRLYKASSGAVKKTDYLRTQVTTSNIRALVEVLRSNEQLVKAALINTMGLDWNNTIEISNIDIPYTPYDADLSTLVADTYRFSPDWSRLQHGLDAADAKIKEAKSGHFPKVALTGSLIHIENSYDKGMMTEDNVNTGILGLVLELPLFSGFRTSNEVKAAKAKLKKLSAQEILLHEGLALQVKDAFLQITRAQGQVSAIENSLIIAKENRELNVRAYQNELVETKEVIEAQIMESFVKAQYQKALHDHITGQAKLDYIVGKQIENIIR